MGARGPAPRPAALKLLNGTGKGRDSGGRPVPLPPKFVREAPDPPDWLSPEAHAEWNRVVPGLERLDILKAEDRAMLTIYCETWSQYVAAVHTVRAEGTTLTNPDSGRVHAHPAVSIATGTAAQMLRYAAEFGLTPSAEQRLSTIAPDDGDPDDDPFAG